MAPLNIDRVVEAIQLIANEFEWDELLVKILDSAAQVVQAESGKLVIKRNDDWFIEAELASADDVQIFPDNRFSPTGTSPFVQGVMHVLETNMSYQHDKTISFPLSNLDNLLGVLYLESTITPQTTELYHLQLIAAQAASSLATVQRHYQEEARHYASSRVQVEAQERTEAKLHEMQQLFRAAQAILGAADLPEICQNLVRHFIDLVPADRMALYLINPAQHQATLMAEHGPFGSMNLTYDAMQQGITGLVMQTKEPILSLHANDGIEPEATRPQRINDGIGALIVVPLITKGEVIGTITVLNEIGHRDFTQRDVDLLMSLATQAAAAIENIRLLGEVQRAKTELESRVSELSILNLITQMVASVSKLPAALKIVAQNATQLIRAQSCHIALLNERRTELNITTEYPRQDFDKTMIGLTIPAQGVHSFAQVIRTKRPVVVNYPQTDPLARPIHKLARRQQISGVVILPLLARGIIIGTIQLSLGDPDRQFTDHEVELAETLATQIAGVIDNVRLFEENARLFEQELRQRQVAESLREVAVTLNSTLDRDEVLDAILDQLHRVIDYDSAGIFFQNNDKLVLSAGTNLLPQDLGWQILLTHDDPVVRVFKERRPHIVADVQADPNWRTWHPDVAIRTWMGAPLIVNGEPIGVLTTDSFKVAAYSETDAQVLEAFAAQAANAIKNARLYADAQESRLAAEEASRSKGTFLANMSHELRTPLNAILGFTQLMQRDPRLDDDHRDNLRIISRSGEHLLELINDVLEMSKIEAGRTQLNPNSFDLNRLLESVVSMFRLRAEEKGLALSLHCEAQLPIYIFTDESKLRQVLINLLSNAIKFTESGHVKVHAARSFEKLSDTQPLPTGPHPQIPLRFAVEDTGPGLLPDELESIFEAFVQTESGRRAQEGTGLGLPISREYVQLMGGDISVRSVKGEGATFMFDVRVGLVESTSEEQAYPSQRVIGLAPDQPAYRLLIAEDRWENQQLLVRLLEPMGFEIQTASNGKEAVDLWASWEPHLIWMDMRMPIMDGYEATQRIKSTPKGEATAIIALTANAFEQDRAAILTKGCDGFIRKPFREAEIFTALANHLGVRFIYEAADIATVSEEPTRSSSEVLRQVVTLPTEQLQAFHQALIDVDLDTTTQLIDHIRPQNPALAKALQNAVDNFEYERLLTIISKEETP